MLKMSGILILISSVSLGMILIKVIKPGIVGYILSVLLSILYGVLLFYTGCSFKIRLKKLEKKDFTKKYTPKTMNVVSQ